MDHQDWKTVVLKKPQVKKTPPSVKVPVSGLNSNNTFKGTGKKISEDDNNEIKKLPNVGISIGKQISQARSAKKLSQKELATKMNLQLHVVQQNENGKALRNNALLAKFERVLGVKFKR
jgi:putative transcription factor|tara:strand:- start:3901 stop:4257 length:357 start_codon:yes stop_codon:yes gene_type:complete